ncbi:hypothetical protein K432DRAFT_429247 [Lepidopterella palustris CBS 459.81]|uniref:Uncharacterized protein n=1 Tax=Lepidopterella palustris CBS 459.81 TaxID=1314670 RepID=A0A8E2E1K7_9PEZI|nr:hypothetical protein K432DRAFT_429247 [Lepidopterella palustris CBS 459.81]
MPLKVPGAVLALLAPRPSPLASTSTAAISALPDRLHMSPLLFTQPHPIRAPFLLAPRPPLATRAARLLPDTEQSSVWITLTNFPKMAGSKLQLDRVNDALDTLLADE